MSCEIRGLNKPRCATHGDTVGFYCGADMKARSVVAGAFAALLETEGGQGVDDWPEETVGYVAKALEDIGRGPAALKLRESWKLHKRADGGRQG